MWAGLFVVPLAAALVGANAARETGGPSFLEQCVSAMMRDGRPVETASAACECIARRTVDKPDLRDEFLLQIGAPRQSMPKSSPALRQVRAACVPMPIWAQSDSEQGLVSEQGR